MLLFGTAYVKRTEDGNQYSLLTFMLPKAEGCCTGLQLSAKEVVLGRPDMVC